MGDTERSKYVSEIIDHFFERQRQATEAVFQHDYVMYGGTRGPGKSHWLRWVNVILLLYWYRVRGLRNVRTGLFCETYPELKDRQITKISNEFPLWLGEIKSTQTDGLGFFLSEENGSGAILLRNLDDPEKYKSAEFAAISVDQLEQNPLETFNVLRGSKRWPGIAHTKFIATSNPGGVGHGFVTQYWIDRNFPAEMQNIADQFVFVRGYPGDNPFLPAEYWQELNSLPEDLRRAWVEGDYTIFSGQAFRQFRRDKHVVDPFKIPDWWPKYRAVDWGFAKPMACCWGAKEPDTGRLHIYRELYAAGMNDRQQARTIREMTLPEEQIMLTYADPSMWERKTIEEIVTSTADVFQQEKVPLTRADNDRLSGKRRIDRLLSPLPDGKPGLVIFSNCVNLIRTLPALPYDKTRVEDVDSDAEDHAYDALRYLTTSYVESPAKSTKDHDMARDYRKLMEAARL